VKQRPFRYGYELLVWQSGSASEIFVIFLLCNARSA
jgi:hypothetical protein